MFFKKPNLRQNTDQILALAKIAATGSLVPLMDSAPALEEILAAATSDDWDFFATVAAAGAGMFHAYRDHPSLDISLAEKAVGESLAAWDGQATAAYSDYQEFVARNVRGGVEYENAVGAWLLWNVKSAEPTARELAAAPAVGRLLCGQMAGSWD